MQLVVRSVILILHQCHTRHSLTNHVIDPLRFIMNFYRYLILTISMALSLGSYLYQLLLPTYSIMIQLCIFLTLSQVSQLTPIRLFLDQCDLLFRKSQLQASSMTKAIDIN